HGTAVRVGTIVAQPPERTGGDHAIRRFDRSESERGECIALQAAKRVDHTELHMPNGDSERRRGVRPVARTVLFYRRGSRNLRFGGHYHRPPKGKQPCLSQRRLAASVNDVGGRVEQKLMKQLVRTTLLTTALRQNWFPDSCRRRAARSASPPHHRCG